MRLNSTRWERCRIPLVVCLAAGVGVAAHAQTFEYVETPNVGGRYDLILAVADLDGDGRDDIVAGGRWEAADPGEPEDRFTKWPVGVFLGTASGRFQRAPAAFIPADLEARSPMVAVADFNADERPDLAIYDYGVYVVREFPGNAGMGNPPQLYLSGDDDRLHRSEALADAVREYNLQGPDVPEISGPADMHLKDLAVGDLDGDGDFDLWVQSMGGANADPHAMINNGDGTFTLDDGRVSKAVHFNRPREAWYFGSVTLADVDGDGDLDVMQGQSRELHETTRNQFSIVLVNDGTGRFPSRIELPHADFHDGYTQVPSMTTFDVNADGALDLILMHTRNDLATDDETGVIPHTGRHIQVLVSRDDGTYGDETETWIKGQDVTHPQHFPDGVPLYNSTHRMAVRDLDRDGCADLLMVQTKAPVRVESPLAYRNNGSGQFEPIPPTRFLPDPNDEWFGYGVWPGDFNGDGVLDLALPFQDSGPDGELGTEDDFTTFMTMLNMTPVQSELCADDGERTTAIPRGRPTEVDGAPPNTSPATGR